MVEVVEPEDGLILPLAEKNELSLRECDGLLLTKDRDCCDSNDRIMHTMLAPRGMLLVRRGRCVVGIVNCRLNRRMINPAISKPQLDEHD